MRKKRHAGALLMIDMAHPAGPIAAGLLENPVAEEAFKAAGLRLVTLSDYEHTTAIAAKPGYIKEEDLAVLAEWRKAPSTWKQ